MAAAITDNAHVGSRHVDDADLLALSATGNSAAFTTLVERLHPLVHRVVWRLTKGHADTEDIAQEAFVRLWKNAGNLREAGAMKSWVLRVASNLAMDRHRRASPALDEAVDVADERPLADSAAMAHWAQRRIDAAIHDLPDRQRLALTLTHFEQLSNGEAASAMDITVDALESLVARARRTLKEKLATDKADLMSAVRMEGH